MSSKQFLYILIATFITALIWVTLDIVHSRAQVQVPAETQKLLQPISPDFDTNALK